MHYATLALGLFLASSPAHAALVTTPQTLGDVAAQCPSVGTTTMAADGTGILACLHSCSVQPTSLTGIPQCTGGVQSPTDLKWQQVSFSGNGGGVGGSYTVFSAANLTSAQQSGALFQSPCATPNPLTGACSCSSGYVASVTSSMPGAVNSNPIYTCFQGSNSDAATGEGPACPPFTSTTKYQWTPYNGSDFGAMAACSSNTGTCIDTPITYACSSPPVWSWAANYPGWLCSCPTIRGACMAGTSQQNPADCSTYGSVVAVSSSDCGYSSYNNTPAGGRYYNVYAGSQNPVYMPSLPSSQMYGAAAAIQFCGSQLPDGTTAQ